MRTDLQSMTPGRAMAQASHASNAFVYENPRHKGVAQWQKETHQGFGTAIVLAADMQQIADLLMGFKRKAPNSVGNFVEDPEYGVTTTKEIYKILNSSSIQPDKTIFKDNGVVVFFKEETTCAYFFGPPEELAPLMKQFQLHP